VTPDKAAHYARMVEVSLLSDNKPRAIAAIEEAFSSEEVVTYDTPIYKLIKDRTTTILHNAGIDTLEELAQESEQSLAMIRNIGPKQIKQLKKLLSDHGYKLSCKNR
jgi:DNA-directed RNA polymerase alpha subunit